MGFSESVMVEEVDRMASESQSFEIYPYLDKN